MSRTDFYQSHLNRVSRSFAFCISHLGGPLKAWVGLTYLICRVLDTIEDAPWKKIKDQLHQFEDFNSFLHQLPKREEVEAWSQRFPHSIPDGEKQLIKETHELFIDLHNSPESVRKIISEMVLSMSRGMKYFMSQKKDQKGHLKLTSLKEVNQYCFFVAGIVGEALARLVSHVEPQFQSAKYRILDAHHFGLFLQKVNLLKDQLNDRGEGREFVYDRKEIFESMSYNAFGAMRFLNALPVKQREFRLFCAWSLFLGLGSLPWLDQLHKAEESGKLPRDEAEEIFNGVEQVIDNPAELNNLYASLFALSGLSEVTEGKYLKISEDIDLETVSWFPELYHRPMNKFELISLGV